MCGRDSLVSFLGEFSLWSSRFYWRAFGAYVNMVLLPWLAWFRMELLNSRIGAAAGDAIAMRHNWCTHAIWVWRPLCADTCYSGSVTRVGRTTCMISGVNWVTPYLHGGRMLLLRYGVASACE